MYEELVRRLGIAAQLSDKGLVIPPSVCIEAADAIENLDVIVKAQKAALDKFPQWIPVTEQLPEEDEDVLCVTNENEIFIAIYMGVMGGDIVFDDGEGSAWLGDITHWMKRPEPPKEET